MRLSDFPLINGEAPSWADVQLIVSPPRLAVGGAAGAAIGGAVTAVAGALAGSLAAIKMVQAINTGVSVETETVHVGGVPVAETTGQLTNSASVVFYRAGYQDLLTRVSLIAPMRGAQKVLRSVVFDMNYQYSLPGSVSIYETRIKNLFLTGREMNDSQGNAAQLVTVNIKPRQIVDVINGVEVTYL
jgi:hypothetical protein